MKDSSGVWIRFLNNTNPTFQKLVMFYWRCQRCWCREEVQRKGNLRRAIEKHWCCWLLGSSEAWLQWSYVHAENKCKSSFQKSINIIAKLIEIDKEHFGKAACILFSFSRWQIYQPSCMSVYMGRYNRAISDLANNPPLLVPVPLLDKQPLKWQLCWRWAHCCVKTF